jgi:hypothetical protein
LEKFPDPPKGLDQLTFMHLNTNEYRKTTCCKTIFHTRCINQNKTNMCPNCRKKDYKFLNDNSVNFVSELDENNYDENLKRKNKL